MADTYWQDPSGFSWFVQDGADPLPGWVQITLSQYNTWYAAHQAWIANNKASLDAANCATRKALFQDLVSSGMSGTAAHALSQWQNGDC